MQKEEKPAEPKDKTEKKNEDEDTEDLEGFDAKLFNVRKVRRNGINYYSLLSEIINAAAPGWGPGGVGGNNLTSIAGKARWSTISTEAEVTNGQKLEPVTISENYWTGWNLKKKDFYKIIDSIEKSLSGLNLGHPFIRKEVFNDSLELQLYEIKSQLVIYPSALNQLRNGFLKAGQVGQERAVVEAMIDMNGRALFEGQCQNMKMYTLENAAYQGFLQRINAEFQHPCLMPWMQNLLEFRSNLITDKKQLVRFQNKLVDDLQGNMKLHQMLNLLGEDNFFFQVRVNGFRKGDERMNLEGGQEFFSDSIGTYNSELEQGIFMRFIKKYKILGYELFARYFSDGV